MTKSHPVWQIVEAQKSGIPRGIYSACTAHPLVLRACMEEARDGGAPVLIEATANQINQFGGYTGMLPRDFASMVFEIADAAKLSRDQVILGGDHLGPLVWASEPEAEAMGKADELIRLFVLAGFTKIHIDTSMFLGDDDRGAPLSNATIARRSARLARVAELAFAELRKSQNAAHPVYVIGSEVPIPGGAQEKEEGVSVTTPENATRTVAGFKAAYEEAAPGAWEHVAALVVQPGVEFGDEDIFEYDRAKASALVAAGKGMGVVFEGHSTDYQTPQALKAMVEDGIAILKVGPALTFAMREALFALSDIEAALGSKIKSPANFKAALETAMLTKPSDWEKHYHGDEAELAFKRRYSFSDRARYYFSVPSVADAIDQLLDNLREGIPLALASQYFPVQYPKIRAGEIPLSSDALLLDRIKDCIRGYTYATAP